MPGRDESRDPKKPSSGIVIASGPVTGLEATRDAIEEVNTYELGRDELLLS
jgi:hypothetical protein